MLLLTGIAPPEIHLHTPGGITFCLPVEDAHMSGNVAVCTVRKDSGDDPDITNRVRITASVRRIEKGVTIEGGAGVRTNYPPGTGDAGRRSGDQSRSAAADRGRSAPCRTAERIRRRLFRYHFGEGRRGACRPGPTTGTSASSAASLSLGTSGIVEPMSEKALVDTHPIELDSLYAQGQRIAFLCPGNYGADFARDHARP